MSLLYQNIFDISIRFFAFFRNNGLLSIKFFCVTLPHMSIRTRIVIAISFHQIDNAPNAKTCANSHNESLQNGNRLIKEFHILFSPDRRFDEYLRFQKESGLAHLRCCPLPAILASPFIFNKVSLLESHDRWWLFRVGHTDHLSGICPNGWPGVSLATDMYLLILVPVRSHPLHKGQILPW